MEADSPPSDWEIRAVIREHLVAQSDVTAWFNANANGLRVVEHNVVLTPKPLSVTVDITDTRPDGPVSCQKYRVLFDMHIYDVDENTANANRALALIERALRERSLDAQAITPAWGYVALRNITFMRRLPQAPEGEGWTIASAFRGLGYYY